MRSDRLLGVGLTLLCSLAPNLGMAEHQPSPLTELRMAAEKQADVECEMEPKPQPVQPQIASGVSKTGVESASVQSEIKTAIRGAIREEVARKIMNPALLAASAIGKNPSKEQAGAEHGIGIGESGASRTAALQSQQVRQSQAVSQAQKAARGQTNGKLMLPPAAGSTARQSLR